MGALVGVALKKQDSINLRISSKNKEILRLAVEYAGQDLIRYLISSALESAKKDIKEHRELQTLILITKDFDMLKNELQNPKGSNVIPKLAKELSGELAELNGFLGRNLKQMVSFYRAY